MKLLFVTVFATIVATIAGQGDQAETWQNTNTYPNNAYPNTYSAYPGSYPNAYPGSYPNAYPSAYPTAYPGAYPDGYASLYPSPGEDSAAQQTPNFENSDGAVHTRRLVEPMIQGSMFQRNKFKNPNSNGRVAARILSEGLPTWMSNTMNERNNFHANRAFAARHSQAWLTK